MKWRIFAVAAIVTAVRMYPTTNCSSVEGVIGFLIGTLVGCALWGFVGNWLYNPAEQADAMKRGS
jgi:xanthine/uracil permease